MNPVLRGIAFALPIALPLWAALIGALHAFGPMGPIAALVLLWVAATVAVPSRRSRKR